MKIISRAQWGARPWNGQPYSVSMSERRYFLVHYHGGEPRNDRGDANAKEIEAIHYANGWSGIGYNFIVGQDGAIREGRGWGLVGAHCPGRNRDGIGVYVAVGGNQEPTEAAKASVRWLYDEACRRAGRTLEKGWHGRYYPTACAGPKLIPWVKAGMPVSGATTTTATPSSAPASSERTTWLKKPIAVHGVWSVGTVKRMQAEVNVVIDGDAGPNTWAGIQRWVGATPDGIRGPQTVKALQKKVGMRNLTGRWTPYLVMQVQRHLNALAKARRAK